MLLTIFLILIYPNHKQRIFLNEVVMPQYLQAILQNFYPLRRVQLYWWQFLCNYRWLRVYITRFSTACLRNIFFNLVTGIIRQYSAAFVAYLQEPLAVSTFRHHYVLVEKLPCNMVLNDLVVNVCHSLGYGLPSTSGYFKPLNTNIFGKPLGHFYIEN